jgi:hypothetical protein
MDKQRWKIIDGKGHMLDRKSQPENKYVLNKAFYVEPVFSPLAPVSLPGGTTMSNPGL